MFILSTKCSNITSKLCEINNIKYGTLDLPLRIRLSHSVGDCHLLFSTKELPRVEIEKWRIAFVGMYLEQNNQILDGSFNKLSPIFLINKISRCPNTKTLTYIMINKRCEYFSKEKIINFINYLIKIIYIFIHMIPNNY